MTRYVLVVHGIGEQRRNETVLSVVNRFAEARAFDAGLTDKSPAEVLTLGLASSQTGRHPTANPCRYQPPVSQFRPWLEFENVPASWRTPPSGPFLGLPARQVVPAANLRFVDVHWADLLQEDFPYVGEDVVKWADSLRGRLERKVAPPAGPDEIAAPFWVRETIRLIRDTVALVRRVLVFRGLEEIDRRVFRDFLGDVQLYGEYAHTRGRAVRRFHKLMARIEAAHKLSDPEGSDPAHYTVIAHSLGTVMSFDALLYARADRRFRDGCQDDAPPNLPFPGYLSDGEAEAIRLRGDDPAQPGDPNLSFLDTSWIDRVDSFVTLGSPIDKYLVLWWNNYEYLTESAWITTSQRRIPHFNYSDEQDPVGHTLDTAEGTAAYGRVFELAEDEVFNRYALPGVAHVNYWQDRDLFRWILFKAVDGVDPDRTNSGRSVPPPRWFDADIYSKILAVSYKATPYTIIVLDFFTFTWAWYSQSWHARALAAVAFVATCLLGRHLIDLTVWWRQVLVAKDPALQAKPTTLWSTGGDVGTAIRRATPNVFRRGTGSGTEDDRLERRKQLGAAFRGRLFLVRAMFLVLAALSTGLYLRAWGDLLPLGRVAFLTAVAGATLTVWVRMFRSRDVAWERGEAANGGPGGGEGRASRPGSWSVDRRWLAEMIGVVLVGWGLVWCLVRFVGPAGDLYGWLQTRYFLLPKENLLRIHGPDVAFSAAAFFVVGAGVFNYLYLRFVDVRRRFAEGVASIGDFRSYARGASANAAASTDPAG